MSPSTLSPARPTAQPAATQPDEADQRSDVSWLLSLRSLPVRVASRVHGNGDAGPGEEGMSTAEYAVGTVAAAGFAGVLYKIITSSAVLELLRGVISRALRVTF